MTITITIERALLDEIVEMFDNAISARYPHEILRDIRAALAAPSTAPNPYDACESFKAYQLACLREVALQKEVDRLSKDAERFVWYESNSEKVLNIGPCWYSRNGYGLPMKRRKGFREAIDAAMKETP